MKRLKEPTVDGRITQDLPEIPEKDGPFWTRVVIQYHTKKTPHWDLRIAVPELNGALSWAIPKRKLPDKGERLLAVETPLHDLDYMNFEGELDDNKGHVTKVLDEKALISYMRPNAIKFSLPFKGRMRTYTLFRRPGSNNWLLMMSSPKEEHSLKFKDYSGKPIDFIKTLLESGEYHAQPKVDGVRVVVDTSLSHPLISTARSGQTIALPHFTIKTPTHIKGSKLIGELFFVNEKGKALPINEIMSLVNSHPEKSREKIIKNNYRPFIYLFDVEKYRGKNYANKPYFLKEQILDKATVGLPWAIPPVTEKDPIKAISLYNEVTSGKFGLPQYGIKFLTNEGIVVRHEKQNRAYKYKNIKDVDVYVCKIFSTLKTRPKKMAGGFYFSFKEGCPSIDGKVGTGFSDELRRDMFAHPQRYVGLVARVGYQDITADRKLRMPRFLGWHPDKNDPFRINQIILK